MGDGEGAVREEAEPFCGPEPDPSGQTTTVRVTAAATVTAAAAIRAPREGGVARCEGDIGRNPPDRGGRGRGMRGDAGDVGCGRARGKAGAQGKGKQVRGNIDIHLVRAFAGSRETLPSG
ncbi:hypothetical protein GCM10010327_01580 [Streptomyces nitrosporeus]|nr:hypothetical protein GCM10010327_01580 [Streptomyces nitrosporeus]